MNKISTEHNTSDTNVNANTQACTDTENSVSTSSSSHGLNVYSEDVSNPLGSSRRTHRNAMRLRNTVQVKDNLTELRRSC